MDSVFEMFAPHLIPFRNKKVASKWRRNQRKVQNKKQAIQDLFKNEMGLLVYKDKPVKSGTTNDWNTARRGFKNYRESARITGVNEDLVRRFYAVLQSISSAFEMNTEEFDKYTKGHG
jgi:hypothetical protein